MPQKSKKRGKNSLTKAAAQARHACRRAYERYGLELNMDKYRQLCKQIQDGKGGVCLGKQSNRLTVWSITTQQTSDLGGPMTIVANVVYDKERHTIVTFLPEGITDAKGVSLLIEQEVAKCSE